MYIFFSVGTKKELRFDRKLYFTVFYKHSGQVNQGQQKLAAIKSDILRHESKQLIAKDSVCLFLPSSVSQSVWQIEQPISRNAEC